MLFCRKFGNVVNHVFLVIIFWTKNAVVLDFSLFANMTAVAVFVSCTCYSGTAHIA